METMQERDRWIEDMMTQWEVPLLRTCFLILRDAYMAEDAVQESFIKAWRAYEKRRKDASDRGFLMRIAVNTCRDMMRSKWMRHQQRSVALDDLPEPGVPFELPDDTLTRAVLALPDALRQCVVLRFYQGFSAEEIARITKCSRRSVYYRLDQAQRLLKSSLKEWYDAE